MKYVLFALSLLLLLYGGYAIYSGSAIMEAERGWASVISGTTALTGGIITLALAWLVKTLEKISALIEAGGVTATLRSALSEAQEAEDADLAAPVPAPVAKKRKQSFAPAPVAPVAPGAAVAWPPHTTPLHATSPEDEAAARAAAFAAPQEEMPDLAQPPQEADTAESFAAEARDIANAPIEQRPLAPERAKISPSVKDIWRRVGKDTGPKPPPARPATVEPLFGKAARIKPVAGEPATALGPAVASEAKQPSDQSDWLDRALAEFDSAIAETPFSQAQAHGEAHAEFGTALQQETSPLGTRPEPAPATAHEHAPERALATAHHETAYHEDAAEPAETPAEEPAVIGRYEADGTSYVMFADGSIEAQSERGVARFKSMAELKAFFETQEAPQ